MRDAFGGIVSITIIVAFLVVVSGYLAFNVTYTKAFRMKNEVISKLTEYNGHCGDVCKEKINSYARNIGYNVGKEANPNTQFEGSPAEVYCSDVGYCWARYDVEDDQDTIEAGIVKDKNQAYYQVTTKVVIDIPIIHTIMRRTSWFTLRGSTELIKVK